MPTKQPLDQLLDSRFCSLTTFHWLVEQGSSRLTNEQKKTQITFFQQDTISQPSIKCSGVPGPTRYKNTSNSFSQPYLSVGSWNLTCAHVLRNHRQKSPGAPTKNSGRTSGFCSTTRSSFSLLGRLCLKCLGSSKHLVIRFFVWYFGPNISLLGEPRKERKNKATSIFAICCYSIYVFFDMIYTWKAKWPIFKAACCWF